MVRFSPWIAALGVALLGCSSAGELEPGPCDPDARFGESRTDNELDDGLLAQRASCQFDAGATTAQTLGPNAPSADAVKHVVVVMLENRSFDHLLSDLPSLGVDAEVATTDDSNPGVLGEVVHRSLAGGFCIGDHVKHEWADVHLQLDNGRRDGFVAVSGRNAMDYYDSHDLPLLYTLASEFTLSDRYFSPLLGPTWPNHLFMMAGSSCNYAEGSETNPNVTLACGVGHRNLLDELGAAGKTYRFYDESLVASVWVGLGLTGAPSLFSAFQQDAGNDRLPQVSFVGGNTGFLPESVVGPEDDDHPPANVLANEGFLFRVVSALHQNEKAWGSTVLFVTWDEHGGFYDHVKPPRACPPEKDAPLWDYGFDQYGFRVPLLIVSPFAKRHYVSHADADHTSVTRFIEHWLGLPALSARDANAWPLLDAFDFEHPDTSFPALDEPASLVGPVSCER
jgi:phospholipase C